MGVLIGVDLGTTNLKAVAFSPSGEQLAKAAIPTPTIYPRADWAEYDPEELWRGVAQVIGEVVAALPKGRSPEAIAFTGMAEAAVPVDDTGKPTYNAISWFDRRVLPQLEWWGKTVGAQETSRITGLPLSPAAGVLRLLWLRDNEPDAFAATRKWLNLPDYMAYRLCGEMATELSLASRMMLLDLKTRGWSARLLAACGLEPALFPALVHGGTVIGNVHAKGASATGLPPGLPVASAGHDHLCAAAGLGAAKPGDLFDSIGTAEAVVTSLPAPVDDPAIAASGVAQGLHALPGYYYAITGNGYGGGSVDWARMLLYGQQDDGARAFADMIAAAEAAGPGAGGAMFLPHLRRANPPIDDPLSRGAFVGLSSDCGPGHLARAVMEGLAYEFQRILDTLSQRFAMTPQRLIASGGGTRNALFIQIKADVSGLPIIVPDAEEATCLGAAMAAGVGSGRFGGFEDAIAAQAVGVREYTPENRRHALYRERYEGVYLGLYDALKPISHSVSAWVSGGNA